MRAAVLHAPKDLRIEEVADPEPGPAEVLVRVTAATTCGTDVKMWRRWHPVLPPPPARFGHEMAGVRLDTGQPVLVSDSVACGRCRPCAAGRPQICRAPRWLLGGFAELLAAPEAALHPLPPGLDAAAAPVAEPLAAVVHAVRRAPSAVRAPEVAVLGGGPVGLMLAAVLVAEGRAVTLVDRHAERRAQAAALGATPAAALAEHDVVFEAVGRPDAWRAAVTAVRAGGAAVLVGGCASDLDVSLPTRPLHYDEVDVLGAFHHSPSEVDAALALLADGTVPWSGLLSDPIPLEDLPRALAAGRGGPARKWLVRPGP